MGVYTCTRYVGTAISPLLIVALLHVVIPGGIIHSHLCVINLLCVSMLLLLASPSRNMKAIGKTAVHFVVMSLCFNVTAILFGAHPLSQFWGTLSWSMLVSLLLLLPSVSFLESRDLELWLRLLLHSNHHCKEQATIITWATTLFGAWCGAFPILLDWNRPWQVWPIPSCIGALVGNAAGGLLGAVLVLHAEGTTTSSKSA